MRGTTLHYTLVFISVTWTDASVYYIQQRSSQVIVNNGMHRTCTIRRLSTPWTIVFLVLIIAFWVAGNAGRVRNYFIHF